MRQISNFQLLYNTSTRYLTLVEGVCAGAEMSNLQDDVIIICYLTLNKKGEANVWHYVRLWLKVNHYLFCVSLDLFKSMIFSYLRKFIF